MPPCGIANARFKTGFRRPGERCSSGALSLPSTIIVTLVKGFSPTIGVGFGIESPIRTSQISVPGVAPSELPPLLEATLSLGFSRTFGPGSPQAFYNRAFGPLLFEQFQAADKRHPGLKAQHLKAWGDRREPQESL